MNFSTALTTFLLSAALSADASSLRGLQENSDGMNDFVPLACNNNLANAPCTLWSDEFGQDTTHNARLVIPCGECVTMDHAGDTLTLNDGIDIIGKLVFPDGYNLELTASVIAVQGELEITATKPVNGVPNIQFTMIGSEDQTFTPIGENAKACKGEETCDTGKKAIVVAGGKVNIHGVPADTPTWTRLHDATGGTFNNPTTIILENTVKGKWVEGADILITSHTRVWNEHQQRTITHVDDSSSAGYVEVTLDSPIIRPTTILESSDYAVEVALLSRNIVFKGGDDDNDRHGGHFWIHHTPTVVQTIEGIDIQNFGQQGTLGKYPVHFHFCGDVPGSVVRKNTIRQSNQRCVVVHGTNQLLIEENVAYDTAGHCFLTEDGFEMENKFIRNLGAQTKIVEVLIPESESSNNGEETDDQPATFWITNPKNTFLGNVGAGSESSAYWFEPKLRGTRASWFRHYYPNKEQLILFKDNVAHSTVGKTGAIRMYTPGYFPTQTATLDGIKAYRNNASGIFIHRCHNLIVANGLFADNNLGVDIDRAEGVIIMNTEIIGESDSYRTLMDRQDVEDVCGRGKLTGLDLHTWKKDTSYAGATMQNIQFSGFGDNVLCSNSASIRFDTHTLKQGLFEFYASFQGITLEDGAENIDLCITEEKEEFDIVFLTDLDGSMSPSASSASGPSTLLSLDPELTRFVDAGVCTDVPEGCYRYCQNTCLRSVRYEVEGPDQANYMLKVCQRDNLSNCSLFPGGRRGDSGSHAFIAHLPVGDSYVAVFVDNMGNEFMPDQVAESFEKSACPAGNEFGISLVASLQDNLPPPTTGVSVGSTENTGDPTCFSGANTVEVLDSRGVIAATRMADLSIGDFVRTANGKFSRVYSFSHIDREAQASYLQIHTNGLKEPLEISRNHMLFVDGTPVRARDVKVGDMMGENKVVAIQIVQRQGIYAPVSTSGDIVVSGVVASCFVALMDISPAIQHVAAQAVLSPVRLACVANFGICENETYTAGRSDFVWKIIQVVRAASQFPIPMQLAGALLATPLMAVAYAIEQVAMIPLLFAAILLSSLFLRRQQDGKLKTKTV